MKPVGITLSRNGSPFVRSIVCLSHPARGSSLLLIEPVIKRAHTLRRLFCTVQLSQSTLCVTTMSYSSKSLFHFDSRTEESDSSGKVLLVFLFPTERIALLDIVWFHPNYFPHISLSYPYPD